MEEPAIVSAETVSDWLSRDQETKRLYEFREKALHDEVTRYEGALEQGRAEGRAKARAEVEAKGKLEVKIEIAQNMLRKGMPDDFVAEITGLPIDRVRKIK